jgi:hypothetical protein
VVAWATGALLGVAGGAQTPTPVRPRDARIVGVFDEGTGKPIEGAQVRDLATGTWASTTATGTVDLFFSDTTLVLIRIAQIGYQPITLPVDNSRRGALPLTVTLTPIPTLDPVVTTAARTRGPADTVRKLELNGFYDRRQTTGAPASAFVTAEMIEKLTLLNDLPRVTGHKICAENLYIDGVRVQVPRFLDPRPGLRGRPVVAPPMKDGIDVLLGTRDVLAIELYDVATTPPQFNPTRPPGSAPCGTTLIWTK